MKSRGTRKPRRLSWAALISAAQNSCGIIVLGDYGFTLVDEEVMEELGVIDWFSRKGYIKRTTYGQHGRGVEYLHRRIMKAEPHQEVDHRNRNPSDNRRENLRLCTHQQNCSNKTQSKSASGYKGVHKLVTGRYRAGGGRKNGFTHLGVYDTALEAAAAYNAWATATFGEFACLNPV